MSSAWPALLGILGVLLGSLLGHLFATRSQQLQWRYEERRRREQREHVARVDFQVEVLFVALHCEEWIVELMAQVANKGQVRHEVEALEFELRALLDSDGTLAPEESIGNQVKIPHVLVSGSWIPATWSAAIFEPGIPNTYSFVTAVPQHAVVVLLHGHARYTTDEIVRHSAEVLVAVPQT